ncbi:thiamine phosphate synthase [Petroclostridium sp. X23]|uniref:thiamine phosphate synthase n=1 Tax=Petroclostridium sp. X23 TaxID=3045146 RepID=UPI0024AC96EC|nr:thiamine phosphate synthase [Petroclostridium sp. X23]WHH57814.1 thiamine phosphate synthase [Petroclostridium sp. X23]
MSVDYTLYLVTDRGVLKGRDLMESVEKSIKGGVTLVQLREKDITSLDFYNIALKLKALTRFYNIPLIINDRLDIALAVDAEGLHIGQEDLPLEVARKQLGDGKILGYSVSNIEEALYGEKHGADYLGVGPVYATGSKSDAGRPIGIQGLKEIKQNVSIPIVGIGGIGISNIKEVKASGINGVSLISAVLGSDDIEEASRNLVKLWEE